MISLCLVLAPLPAAPGEPGEAGEGRNPIEGGEVGGIADGVVIGGGEWEFKDPPREAAAKDEASDTRGGRPAREMRPVGEGWPVREG